MPHLSRRAAAGLLAGLAGILAVMLGPGPGTGATDEPRAAIEVGDAPALGPEHAPVTIVEFSDFMCPFCARGSRVLRQVLPQYRGQVRLVFKHYPLRGGSTRDAHVAAVAAHDQGRFWDMYAVLFARQGKFDREQLVQYAADLGLDTEAFVRMLDARRTLGLVLRDQLQGRQLGVTATPTYFVNGTRVVGARDAEEFKGLIERALQESRPPTPAGGKE